MQPPYWRGVPGVYSMPYKGRVFDVDVHHQWASDETLLGYLPQPWRQYVNACGAEFSLIPSKCSYPIPDGTVRVETIPSDGAKPGSSYEMMREQLLDPLEIERVMLNFDTGLQAGFFNPYLAGALCSAANRWTVEHWLDRSDPRLYGSILVAPEIPEQAVAEIRRWADHPRVSQVLLMANPMGKPFGHPHYHPIYRAATETGLPVSIHVGGEGVFTGREAAGGVAGSTLERFVLFPQAAMHYVTSFVTHGVFEEFPELKVMIAEFGYTWLPDLVWRMEAMYPTLHTERPTIRRWPREYIHDHMMFSTQPVDYVDPEASEAVLTTFDEFKDILCFSTDYPHWDAEPPTVWLQARLPKAWHESVFWGNAARFYGWN
jgi:predicted TIM-barrel fold metal-dependent hydrolase